MITMTQTCTPKSSPLERLLMASPLERLLMVMEFSRKQRKAEERRYNDSNYYWLDLGGES